MPQKISFARMSGGTGTYLQHIHAAVVWPITNFWMFLHANYTCSVQIQPSKMMQRAWLVLLIIMPLFAGHHAWQFAGRRACCASVIIAAPCCYASSSHVDLCERLVPLINSATVVHERVLFRWR
jgi:hypothetical protein